MEAMQLPPKPKGKQPLTIDLSFEYDEEPQQQKAREAREPGQVRKVSLTGNQSPSPHSKNCLCSPTTHAGSFRCRLHRSLQRRWSLGERQPSPPASTLDTSLVEVSDTVKALVDYNLSECK